MIEIRVAKHLGNFSLDLSLNLRKGLTVLFGPSGSGKTLTLHTIAGLVEPDSGRVRVNGVVYFDKEEGVNLPIHRRRVGYVFQEPSLFPHMTVYNPRKQIYYVSDLGLDRIHQLRLDTTIGRLMTEDVPFLKCSPGSGPRHMAIDKNNVDLFVINELNSTISVFNILSDTTDIKQTVSTLPQGYQDTSFCADLHLSANGRRLYGSNRGHNSLVTFAVGAGGRLSSPVHQSCGGNWPRNFAVDPSGKYFVVANQRSNEVSVIPADRSKSDETGTGLKFNAPSCIKFMK